MAKSTSFSGCILYYLQVFKIFYFLKAWKETTKWLDRFRQSEDRFKYYISSKEVFLNTWKVFFTHSKNRGRAGSKILFDKSFSYTCSWFYLYPYQNIKISYSCPKKCNFQDERKCLHLSEKMKILQMKIFSCLILKKLVFD